MAANPGVSLRLKGLIFLGYRAQKPCPLSPMSTVDDINPLCLLWLPVFGLRIL